MKSKYYLLSAIFLVFSLLLQLKHLFFTEDVQVSTAPENPTILIDAGHGGEDGGAVSVTGSIESNINLAIALDLKQLLLFYGIEPVLLREEDISLHDPELLTVKEKKTSDLKNRVEIVNQYENPLLLSIHQNIYTEEKYFGAQVFYTEEAQVFAQNLQDLLCEYLNPENTRVSKAVDPSLYLFNHIEASGILVECGFLSNNTEASLLDTPEYQLKIACVLLASITSMDQDKENL
ncbi:MAG: N-acetylmuramoyl-L-alanine amidase [Eubacteriales bacterium]